MNCDRVFDILTRGPFPSGAPSDDRVEMHLANCPACRRLAAALQPAIELFEEAITPDEGRDLPAYWGDLFIAEQDELAPRFSSTWRSGTSTRIATRLQRATGLDLETVRRTLPTAWRLSAAILLGICIGGLLRSADLGATGSVASFGGSQDDTASRVTMSASLFPLSTLEDLKQVACRAALPESDEHAQLFAPSGPAGELPSELPMHAQHLSCCHKCHADKSLASAPTPQFVVTNSCSHCHDTSDAVTSHTKSQ